MHQTVHVFISGSVQGVGYRRFLKQEAAKYKVTGWVKNCSDTTTVEAVFSGQETAIETILRHVAHGGPILSKVTHIETTVVQQPPDYIAFSVLQ